MGKMEKMEVEIDLDQLKIDLDLSRATGDGRDGKDGKDKSRDQSRST